MNIAMTQNATIEHSWKRFPLTDKERTDIQERVREIGQLLQDPSQVYKLASLASQRSRYSISLSTSARFQSLALGPLGLALLFEEMDRALPGERWDEIAHRYLAQAQEHVQKEEPASFGLFSGASGLLFIALHLSRSGTRSPESCQRFAASIFSAMDTYFIPHDVPRPETFALTSGAIGMGATLLTMAEQPLPTITTRAQRYLERLVHHLSWLALRDRDAAIDRFVHWYPNKYLQEAQTRWLPEVAYHGFGLRRGLAGLISLLSLVLESDLDINEEEVADALDLLCTRVRDEITRSNQGWQLPQDTEGDHYHRPGVCAPFAWCNGVSGIARALGLAGRALGNDEFTTFAQEGITQAIRNFKQDPLRVGPSLCHGVAGLLQVCMRFAGETENLALDSDIRAMLHRLLELFEPDRPFGYRSFEPEYIRVDTPWLLDGASGVALTLLSLLGPVAPAWDRILLLS
jgi:hypothetical protein